MERKKIKVDRIIECLISMYDKNIEDGNRIEVIKNESHNIDICHNRYIKAIQNSVYEDLITNLRRYKLTGYFEKYYK